MQQANDAYVQFAKIIANHPCQICISYGTRVFHVLNFCQHQNRLGEITPSFPLFGVKNKALWKLCHVLTFASRRYVMIPNPVSPVLHPVCACEGSSGVHLGAEGHVTVTH